MKLYGQSNVSSELPSPKNSMFLLHGQASCIEPMLLPVLCTPWKSCCKNEAVRAQCLWWCRDMHTV